MLTFCYGQLHVGPSHVPSWEHPAEIDTVGSRLGIAPWGLRPAPHICESLAVIALGAERSTLQRGRQGGH